MTPDAARELFSAAYDGDLEDAARAEFEAALAADPELKQDYAKFRSALDLARGALGGAERFGGERGATTGGGAGGAGLDYVPNLLPGVQHRLRARSRGRYYGNRYAERGRRGRMSPVYLFAVGALALVSLWVALHFIETVQPGLYPM